MVDAAGAKQRQWQVNDSNDRLTTATVG